MNGLAATAIIVGAFFAAGMTLGATGIISLSVTRRRAGRTWPQFAGRDDGPGRVAEPTPLDPDQEVLQDSDDYPGSTSPWPRNGSWS